MDAIKPHKPFTQVNEVLLKDRDGWLHFAEPLRVFEIDSLKEVIPALQEIEDLTRTHQWHAAGFLSYEAASACDAALRTVQSDSFPYLWFGLYSEPRIVNPPEPSDPTQGAPASVEETLSWLPTTDRETYNAAIRQIKEHIANGLTYQVNYTMRLRTEFKGDPWGFFLQIANLQNKYAAYIDTGRYVICSASPELFFHLDGGTLTCRPMKGTVKRGRTTQGDKTQVEWLRNSEKNRAENVMIVDMVRNDLGRIAKIGSVEVPELFTIEKYPTLWQMTSTVQARTHASLTEIFKALFPCASITGAPKVSTMKIISELETTPRRIYTGSIGYISPSRKAVFNVAIRTAVIHRQIQTAEYGVGGGIVWDSTSADEYAEALLKARVLTGSEPKFSLLETMLWTPGEGFFLRDKHIARLLDSAEYFDFHIRPQRSGSRDAASLDQVVPKEFIEAHLHEISSRFTSPQRVRLLLDKNGNLSHEARPFEPVVLLAMGANGAWKVSLAREPIHSGNVFLFHKTTHREVYESARSDFPDCDDVLLYNERGELTEFTIGNLVVEMDGKYYTPPVACGLLAGTFREHLLEAGQVSERVIRVEELKKCSRVFLVNSVRKWQETFVSKTLRQACPSQ